MRGCLLADRQDLWLCTASRSARLGRVASKHVGGESAMCWCERARNAIGNDTVSGAAQHLKEDKAAMRINRALMPDALHPEAVGMDARALPGARARPAPAGDALGLQARGVGASRDGRSCPRTCR